MIKYLKVRAHYHMKNYAYILFNPIYMIKEFHDKQLVYYWEDLLIDARSFFLIPCKALRSDA